MRIQNPQAVATGLNPLASSRTSQTPAQPTDKQTKSRDGDALDFSLSASISQISNKIAEELAAAPVTLDPERMVQIQNRITSGFYSHPQIAAETASQVFDFYGQ
jgi:hypothetical protein